MKGPWALQMGGDSACAVPKDRMVSGRGGLRSDPQAAFGPPPLVVKGMPRHVTRCSLRCASPLKVSPAELVELLLGPGGDAVLSHQQ